MKDYQYIDVSGLGNAGKSAVTDFLREFDSVYVPEYSFEFDLFRLPNGLIDLYQDLVVNWSPIRSNHAVRAFRELAYRMAGSQHRKSIKAYLFSVGTAYEHRFKGEFSKLSEEYTSSLIDAKYEAFWPYYLHESSVPKRAFVKLMWKLRIDRFLRSEIYLTSGEEFKEKTSAYINRLYSLIDTGNAEHIVFNNAFEPFRPDISLNILNRAKSIIVYRDPRDVYVSGLSADKVAAIDRNLQAFDNNGINKSFLATDDLEIFVTRQKIYFEKMFCETNASVKSISFERFVLNSKEATQDVMKFVGLTPEQHKNQGKFFISEHSKKNIGIWKRYSNQAEVDYIERELKDYCYRL